MYDTNLSNKGLSQHRFLILVVLLFGIAISINYRAHAQEDNELWVVPVNLSQSGAASAPRLVNDSGGESHVLWREDAVNSFYYTRRENGQWRKATPVEVPFGTDRYLREELGDRFNEEDPMPLNNPDLVADNNGRIHAFWVDGDDHFYHSSVLADDFGNYESWSPRRLLSESTLASSLAVDNRDTIHLAYVDNTDTAEAPAGVYYRRLSRDGESWSDPKALFKSAYFRAASSENLNLQIRTGMPPDDTTGVYIVLDNRPHEEVLIIRSEDRGETWEEPSVIDRRRLEDQTSSVGPTNIDIISTGKQLHLIWLAGHDSYCQLYHQWSDDDGLTWQPAYTLELDYEGCPTEQHLLTGSNKLLYLLTTASDGSYFLQAWNGEKWSQGESQPILSGFEDPITLRRVELNCHQFTVDPENNFGLVGCGSGAGNEDIWLVERALGDEEYWFPTKPVTWSEPVSLVSSESRLLAPLVFSGSENLLHTFWISSGEDDETVSNADIYYTSWNGDDWSRQVPLLHLNTKRADSLSGIFDRDEGLFILWRDQETNTYYYSAVKSEDILLPAEWSSPMTFPKLNSDTLFSAPVPFLDSDGVMNVIYSIPLNEGRGIYLMQAADDERTWSEPIVVVDAVGANWAMVDKPSMAQTGNGDRHVVFTVYSLEPEPVAQALYYTRSGDDGITWSEAELVAEGDIRWSQIVGIGPQTVLITWQQEDDGQFLLWSQQSTTGGVEWERPLNLLERSTVSDSFDLVTQLPDYPYLVQVQEDLDGGLFLQERIWRDNAWQAVEFYELDTRLENENLLDLAVARSENDRLLAIFNTETIMHDERLAGTEVTEGFQPGIQQLEIAPLENDVLLNNLYLTHRSIEMPVQSASSEGDLGADPSSISTPSAELAPIPDPSLPALAEPTNDDQVDAKLVGNADATNESTSDMNRILIGLAPAVLIVLIVFAIGIRRAILKR